MRGNGHLAFSTSGANANDEWWIPPWHWNLGSIGEAGIFVRMNLEFNPHVDFVRRKHNNENTYNEYYRTEFVAGLVGEFGLGAKAVVLPDVHNINIVASGYAFIRNTLEGSFNFPLDGSNTFELTWYIDPLNFTFQLQFEIAGYELVNYDDTWHFFDRMELGPAKIYFDE